MNYAKIKETDVANGPGVRVSLFVSGCTHHCKGCFNPETWDFQYGQLYTQETENMILQALNHDYIRGISILGGEPFEEDNRGTIVELLQRVKAQFPQKDIWCYSGYHYENDMLPWVKEGKHDVLTLLEQIDFLVDGEFIENQKNLRLPFRGSENQRIINVPASLEKGLVVL